MQGGKTLRASDLVHKCVLLMCIAQVSGTHHGLQNRAGTYIPYKGRQRAALFGPTYTSYFILNYYPPCLSNSNHTGLHCILQTHQAPFCLEVCIFTISHLPGPLHPTVNQFLTCLALSYHSHNC